MITIAWDNDEVCFLDQTRLPVEELYVRTRDYRRVGDAIRNLQVRGAPAIGVAAAFGSVLAINPSDTLEEARAQFEKAAEYLSTTRPTAVNLFTALARMRSAAHSFKNGGASAFRKTLLDEARAIEREDVEACARIGALGAELLLPGSSVLTHCNAGALATAGSGTALSVITTAARQKKVVRVYADETRPLLQGARLTTWELVHEGIEVVLITDSAAATVLRQGKVQAVIVGADRIAANGDTANKIGTYPLAVLAARHNIPFYVAAPVSTLDPATPHGEAIVIEERDPSEVTHFAGVRVAAEGVRVFSPAFDVTPNELISAIVTERGVLRPPFARAIAALQL